MELSILTPRRMKARLTAVFLLGFLWMAGIWRAIDQGSLASLDVLLEFRGLFGALPALIFPAVAAAGLLMKRTFGVRTVTLWLYLELIGTSFSLVAWGPSLTMKPGIWAMLVGMLALFLLIGPRELWGSQWVHFDQKKSFTSLRFNKAMTAIAFSMAFVLSAAFFIHNGLSMGFAYAPLLPLESGDIAVSEPEDPPLPFAFQVALPASAQVVRVELESGTLILLGQRGEIWRLSSENHLHATIREDQASDVRAFLSGRIGQVPTLIKGLFFGESPEAYFKIERERLWAVGSIHQDSSGRTPVALYLWDEEDHPLGYIRVRCSSPQPQHWQWVHSLQRSREPLPEPTEYRAEAKKYSLKGDHHRAGRCLAYAVLAADGDDRLAPLKALTEHMERHSLASWAQRQLEEARKAFPEQFALGN